MTMSCRNLTPLKQAALLLCIAIVATISFIHVRGERAKVIAKNRIEEYCKNENIPLAAMSAPIISKEKLLEWIFDYTSKTNPKHEVRFLIDIFGHVKTHRFIEDDKGNRYP